MNIINPATGAVIISIQEDDKQSITKAFQMLKTGQKLWSKEPVEKRIAAIEKFSQLLSKEINNLAEILTSETGKPLVQSINEIKGAINRIHFFINNSQQWIKDETISNNEGMEERISFEPLGVIANISAWNYPYLIGVNVFIPALIAGNSVIYKPSEYATLTGISIQELLYKSGIPEDVFQTVKGAKTTGETVLQVPINGCFFTGSYPTGISIYKNVAEKMIPCQLELGGKDPLYVADDNDDIAKVAVAAAEGAFYNNGQSCCSVERIYVHQKVFDEFISAFKKEVSLYKVGNPLDSNTFIGPLTRKEQSLMLSNQVKDAVAKGAKLLLGGKEGKSPYYFDPTVLINVNHSMAVMKNESFGPVIGIQSVSDDKEAIELMKDTEYGLTASIYSKNRERAEKIMDAMDTGSVYWNCCDRVSANLPWSGRNKSGIGTTLSYIGIRAFVQPKAYHFNKT